MTCILTPCRLTSVELVAKGIYSICHWKETSAVLKAFCYFSFDKVRWAHGIRKHVRKRGREEKPGSDHVCADKERGW